MIFKLLPGVVGTSVLDEADRPFEMVFGSHANAVVSSSTKKTSQHVGVFEWANRRGGL
jgi:hypothetical protein